ncbi:31640_t:CDS:2 [Gigaspora margarita]|uniref:31640_t:CDS:1 n=1 Tax=Gigaspora margarita TaxID=4874 RepID=A0ABN7W3A3_GIGMA|nr:31640_t:CDS:2 [Gigaspora margarita]
MSSYNNVNDEEPSSKQTTQQTTQQTTAGRPFHPVWKHFNQIEKQKGEHYSASCKYCPQKWSHGDLAIFKMHLAHNCPKAPIKTQLFYFKQLVEDDENQKSKKRKLDLKNKEDILKYVKNQELSLKRQEQLENDLRPGFKIPSPKILVERIFNKQVIQIEAKIEKKLQSKKYITLEHLYALRNYSDAYYIAKFLTKEIKTIITQIGSEKICAIVSDSIANVVAARRLITQQFPHIITNAALEAEIQINNIVSGGIKRYVVTHWSSYFDTINSILHLKVAFIRVKSIIQLESQDSTLADCFIHLIKLATTIYQMPQDQHVTFRRHCITSINRRLSEFNNDTYRLAYLLHLKFRGQGFKPGQYKQVANYASTLWKAINSKESSGRQFLEQLATYKLNKPPFNELFESDSFEKVEALAKIHQYYTTHAKEEISYIDHELTLEDVLAVANETEDFELNYEIFRENDQNDNIESNFENVVEEEPNYDYDIDNLVNEFFS